MPRASAPPATARRHEVKAVAGCRSFADGDRLQAIGDVVEIPDVVLDARKAHVLGHQILGHLLQPGRL